MSNRTSKPNIRKRGSTYTWYAYITGGDGRRRQISQGGFRTIAEAENDRIKKLTELGHGDYVTPDKITLASYLLDEWLPARRIDLEPSTWRSYEQKIRLHVVPHIGGIALQELTPMDLNELYRQLLDTTTLPPATSRKHPPETIERMLELHAEGTTAAGIAETLRTEGHESTANLTAMPSLASSDATQKSSVSGAAGSVVPSFLVYTTSSVSFLKKSQSVIWSWATPSRYSATASVGALPTKSVSDPVATPSTRRSSDDETNRYGGSSRSSVTTARDDDLDRQRIAPVVLAKKGGGEQRPDTGQCQDQPYQHQPNSDDHLASTRHRNHLSLPAVPG